MRLTFPYVTLRSPVVFNREQSQVRLVQRKRWHCALSGEQDHLLLPVRWRCDELRQWMWAYVVLRARQYLGMCVPSQHDVPHDANSRRRPAMAIQRGACYFAVVPVLSGFSTLIDDPLGPPAARSSTALGVVSILVRWSSIRRKW